MKEVEMEIDWRTVQLFLDENGVAEVEVDVENNKKVRCTCKTFSSSARCKHVKYVRNLMEQNDGHYSVQIDVNVPDEEAIKAMSTREGFREFVLKYAKVEVID